MPVPGAGLITRRIAAETLRDVLQGQSFQPIDAARLDDSRDRAFCNRLITTALRRHGHINAALQTLLERGLPKRAGLFEPILRIALSELLYVRGAAPHAAISAAVELLKTDRRGGHLHKLMNGVLREAQRQAGQFMALPDDLVIPEIFRDRWRQTYGDAMLAEAAAGLLSDPPLDLTLRRPGGERPAELGGEEIVPGTVRLTERTAAVPDLPGYAEGHWWVQDAAATLPARLIDSPQGANVLDLCAAPGGKTAQLCARGLAVTALDSDEARLTRLRENLARLGLDATVVCADATETIAGGPFDAILIDAPCTATGTYRRHPEVLLNRSIDDIASRVAIQRAIVTAAVEELKPGGTLVYAVCSLEPEEGERQAEWMVNAFPTLTAHPVGIDSVSGFELCVTSEGWVRIRPGLTDHAMDGFFAARFHARS